uniref:Predicted aspartyl protease n=1 Tax=Candidatus Kentrum sp. LFY TaxID=2126342 RepID=A0A450U5W4_9GAMM|nr:MAG: Predicted aspartyl protease [Candidatus Kentron sp. LFY]
MGLVYIKGTVSGPTGKKLDTDFLVDSGATYSLLAEKDWKELGLERQRSATFTLADGTTMDRGISECHLTLPQGEGHMPVILGEGDDEPLLGVVTLEILGLILNPFNRTLQPMRTLLVRGSKCEG